MGFKNYSFYKLRICPHCGDRIYRTKIDREDFKACCEGAKKSIKKVVSKVTTYEELLFTDSLCHDCYENLGLEESTC